MKVERNAAQAELAALQKQIADGKIRSTENPRWTPRAQAALELAKEEAGDQMASYVGTDHVLLGLLRQDDGISKRIFLAAGLTYEKAAFALRVSRCH